MSFNFSYVIPVSLIIWKSYEAMIFNNSFIIVLNAFFVLANYKYIIARRKCIFITFIVEKTFSKYFTNYVLWKYLRFGKVLVYSGTQCAEITKVIRYGTMSSTFHYFNLT